MLIENNFKYISPGDIITDNIISACRSAPNIINWDKITSHYYITISFAKEFQQYLRWDIINMKELSEDFIERFSYLLDWNSISLIQNLSESFIERHVYEINWSSLSMNHMFSYNFIEKHKDRINWSIISDSKSLSEEFIERFKNELDLSKISCNILLSESFIEKHKDILDWNAISSYQDLSESFIIKMKDRINFYKLSGNSHKCLTLNIINNCYELISKLLIDTTYSNIFDKLSPEAKLYYSIN